MYSKKITIKSKDKLPPISSWFTPNYKGEGDLIVRKKSDKPKKWKERFPEYNYKYTKLQEIKRKVNNKKSELDPICTAPNNSNNAKNNVKNTNNLNQKYTQIRNASQIHEALRGKEGILVQQYNAEIVTNAWLKFYEICNEYLCPMMAKASRSKSKTLISFHLAEAPGNFILSLNHFMKTRYPDVTMDWKASTYKNTFNGNVSHLGDSYGLINKYKNSWIYGADGDGDITSPANIRSFRSCIDQRLKVHLVTSDVKVLIEPMDYNNEENVNIPAHLGQLLSALNILSKGGNMVLKILSIYEAASVNMIYLAAQCFDELYICKPHCSRAANSEIYLVGIGFNNSLSIIQMECLLNAMRYIRQLISPSGSPCLFKKDDIPRKFVDQIIAISDELAREQIKNIDNNIKTYNKYKNSNIDELNNKYASSKEKFAEKWIEHVQITALNDDNKMLKDEPEKSTSQYRRNNYPRRNRF